MTRTRPEGALRLQEIHRLLKRVAPDAAPAILPGVPIAIIEAGAVNPRAVIESPDPFGTMGWAVLAAMSHPTDPIPVAFEADPFKGATRAYSLISDQKAYLCIPDTKGLSLPLYFSTNPAAVPAQLTATGTNVQFTLSIQANGQNYNVCAGAPNSGAGGWSWLYAHPTDAAASFSTEYFALDRHLLETLLKRQWPALSLQYLGRGDAYYGVLSNAKAKAIWNAANFGQLRYQPDVFDCEDFSYVYKAQVSRQQYADYVATGIKFAYAAGSIVGDKPPGAHAVNIFIDETFTAQILEPQNGTIVPGSQWGYTPRTIWF
ncbi:lectin MOA-related protein [Corallococcus sp. M7]